MHAALIAAVLFAVSGAAPLPIVEQEVACISVCHLDDSQVLLFFFDEVQGEWTQLAHCWAQCSMAVSWTGSRWQVEWDDAEEAHRIVTTACWVETWESISPLLADQNAPWFRRLLEPGLRAPPRLAQSN